MLPVAVPPSSEEKTYAQQVWEEFYEAKNYRSDFDLSWWTAHQWTIGNTEVFFDQFSRGRAQIYQVRYGDSRSKRVRPINWCGNIVDAIVGKDIRARPTFHASPTTDLDNDKLAARAARDWLRWFWNKEKLTGRRRKLYTERAVTGNAFMMPFWDEMGPPFVNQQEDCPTCVGRGFINVVDQGQVMDVQCPACKGAGQGPVKRKAIGDVRVAIIPAWEIYPLSGAMSIKEGPGLFRAYKMTVEAAAHRYGVDPDRLTGTSHAEESEFESWSRDRRGTEFDQHTTMVLERYLPPLPGEEHPRITVVVGGETVWPKDGTPGGEEGWIRMPEPYGRIPIVHFKWRETPGSFFAEGAVLDMIPGNDSYNRLRSLVHRQAVTTAHEKVFYHAGSVNTEQLRNIEGEMVEVFGPEYPKRQSGSPMPEYIFRFMDNEHNNMRALAHLNDMDRGVAPPNIEAAQALAILAETGDTPSGGRHVEDQTIWAELGKLCLICARANYGDEQRFVHVAGEGTEVEVSKFLASDITSNIDVTVDISSALDHSLAMRRNDVINAVNAGIVDPKDALRLMEFGTKSEVSDIDRKQESYANLEVEEILNEGKPHLINPHLDDHEIHFRIHQAAALEKRMSGDMDAANKLGMAAMEHKQIMMQMQGPPGPGGPGGPGGQMPQQQQQPFDSGPPTAGPQQEG